MWTDWEQYKKNLAIERKHWADLEPYLKVLEEEYKEKCYRLRENLRMKKETLDREFKDSLKKLGEEYSREKRKAWKDYQDKMWDQTETSLIIFQKKNRKRGKKDV